MAKINRQNNCAFSNYAKMAKKATEFFVPEKKTQSPLQKLCNQNYISVATGFITSIIAERGKKIESIRREKERQLARQRCKSTRNMILAGAGGAVAGIAAGYVCARTLQLTGKYRTSDNDVYRKNPQLSDYAPSPAPNQKKKEYMPFSEDLSISVDGTTIIKRA